ncbi:hypothetical protein BC751_2861 [Cecembia calidifontis]|jgi:hypothetical protein|uniref:Alginate export protein n=2 Tax=Cecembia calidifontis TaxID=1187080 RepID=A0A4Q7PC35_9BACT|nr:hypothetical protein BC751_2861 [Cecembia calidifontis]
MALYMKTLENNFFLAISWFSLFFLSALCAQKAHSEKLFKNNEQKTETKLSAIKDPVDFQDSIPEKNPFPEFRLNGYFKILPSFRNSKALEKGLFDNLIHNRLNLRVNFNEKWTTYGSLRTRHFVGGTVREFPFFKDFLDTDFGYFDLSWIIWSGNNFAVHSTIDRFYTEYKGEKWQLRIGRQRVNWGINLVSNPNDLFNTYSFFDFDYEERPGTDALRFSYYTGDLSRFEMVIAPRESVKESVAAVYYSLNHRGYDIQLLTGYFEDRWTGGFGWAGSIKNTGFKGEFSYFRDLNPLPGIAPTNVVVATSVDHMFSNSIFLVVEYLYNQPREGREQNILLLNRPLKADNLSFTDHSIFAQARYPLSPILDIGLAGFYYPSEKSVFFSPSITGNLVENLDLLVIGQFFAGGKDSIFAEAGSLVAMALKWSF